MNIRLVMISEDTDYVSALSKVLSEAYAERFEVSIWRSVDQQQAALAGKAYDIVLADQNVKESMLPAAQLYAILWDGGAVSAGTSKYVCIRKYQRISRIVSELMEEYAKIAPKINGMHHGSARITAVWSPAGGSGKTTVAMAYAASRTVRNMQVIYLNLEYFSSSDVYFQDSAKSVSRLFEALNGSTNMEVLLAGLKKKDSASGIMYFGRPDNYDDINILTESDIDAILSVCAAQADELVIDLPSSCEERVRHILDRADKVLAVVDGSPTGAIKWEQFQTQHNVYERIEDKLAVVANKGAAINDMDGRPVIRLPLLKAADPIAVYKNLSMQSFD